MPSKNSHAKNNRHEYGILVQHRLSMFHRHLDCRCVVVVPQHHDDISSSVVIVDHHNCCYCILCYRIITYHIILLSSTRTSSVVGNHFIGKLRIESHIKMGIYRGIALFIQNPIIRFLICPHSPGGGKQSTTDSNRGLAPEIPVAIAQSFAVTF